ncbi:MAG: sigma-E processing peptidase SpoIIGA [Clostridia bacterium]|nr:sigma-E processing peptidase SpoIIGA [Clostridia bacterium]
MTIYADVLIITNFIVDYFLLSVTGKAAKQSSSLPRSLVASLFAALGSLVILFPEQNIFIRLLFRLSFGYIICIICFGYKSFRRITLISLIFFAVTTCFAGAMLALWYISKPYGMVVNNSVVYFDISPVFLIVFSVVGFIIFSLLSHFFSKRSKTAEKCFVTLSFLNKKASFDGIIDSGNSLSDGFTQRAVIILDNKNAKHSFGELSPLIYSDRYRAIPCGTVAGTTILDGFRCDSGVITTEKKVFNLEKPIMAISKVPLCDCAAIVNPLDCT